MQNYRRPFWEVSRADKAKLRPILLSPTHAQTARIPGGARRWPRPPGCECAGVAGEGGMVSTGLTGSLVASVWRATSKAIRPGSPKVGDPQGKPVSDMQMRRRGDPAARLCDLRVRAFPVCLALGPGRCGWFARSAPCTRMQLGQYGKESHFGDECH